MLGDNLNLENYKEIFSKFCFLDESGSLSNLIEPLFTIGIIKCSQPYYLYSKIQYNRNKFSFYDELKFNKISSKNLNFAKQCIGYFLETKSVNYYSYTVDKGGRYFQTHFSNDVWKAYEEITIKLISDAVMSKNELLIIIADHVTTPKNVKFEVNVKNIINRKNNKLSIAGVCRIDSKSNDLLQVVDLISGCINYDLKLFMGTVSGDKNKIELLNFLKQSIGVDNFCNGYKNKMFNVFVDKDFKNKLPLKYKK